VICLFILSNLNVNLLLLSILVVIYIVHLYIYFKINLLNNVLWTYRIENFENFLISVSCHISGFHSVKVHFENT
jgi:hypothetical protein